MLSSEDLNYRAQCGVYMAPEAQDVKCGAGCDGCGVNDCIYPIGHSSTAQPHACAECLSDQHPRVSIDDDADLPTWDTPAVPVDPNYDLCFECRARCLEDGTCPRCSRKCCTDCGALETACVCPIYVNVYLQTQERGGPEEGGWYYYRGEPVESRRVSNEHQAERLKRHLMAHYEENNQRLHKEFWTKHDDYVVLIERGFAQPYPDHRPHYE